MRKTKLPEVRDQRFLSSMSVWLQDFHYLFLRLLVQWLIKYENKGKHIASSYQLGKVHESHRKVKTRDHGLKVDLPIHYKKMSSYSQDENGGHPEEYYQHCLIRGDEI